MDMDTLHALLAVGAVLPYAAVAIVCWIQRAHWSRAARHFVDSHFSQLPN